MPTLRPWPFATLLLVACASPRSWRPFGSEVVMSAPQAQLEAHWERHFALVNVRLDGGPEQRFLLDTGASALLLAQSTVDELRLPTMALDPANGGFVLHGADDSTARVQRIVPLATLQCGPLTMRNVDALVLDLSPLQQVCGQPVAGVLPATMFRDCVLTIDYPERRVEVASTTTLAPAELGRGGTLSLREGTLPRIELAIDGRSMPVLLDSGSSGPLALPKSLPLTYRTPPRETGKQMTVGGMLPSFQARLGHDVDWAGHVLRTPIVDLQNEDSAAVGTGVLAQFRVILDQPRRRVTFVRSSREPIPFAATRGQGFGFRIADDAWTVAYVLDDTPAAAAGLREGDRIVAVDGRPVAGLTRADHDAAMAGRESTTLRVQRAGEADRDLQVPIVVLLP